MSIYVAIGGAIIGIVGHITNLTAGVIFIAKSNQSKDKGEKNALKIASILSFLSVPLLIIILITGMKTLALRGCPKNKKFLFIFSLVLLIIFFLIIMTIGLIYAKKRRDAGDTAGNRDITSAWRLVLAGYGLNVIAFIILYLVIGKKFAKIGKACRKVRDKARRLKSKVPSK